MSDNAIQTECLSRRFGPTEAVRNLNLAVPAGSFFAFLGPNGAGKTTTIRCLLNLLAPHSGRAEILGADSRRLSHSDFRKIAYVSENHELPLALAPGELMRLCRSLDQGWDDVLARRLAAEFALPETKPLSQLSRGMRARTALLIALARRPRLLILDEPFSGLDPAVRNDLVNGLLDVARDDEWTVFISSHDIEEIERLADWIGFIQNGSLTLAEKCDSLIARHRRVFVAGIRPDAGPPGPPPPGAGSPHRQDGAASFVLSRYDTETSEHAIREWAGESARVEFARMSLREIFIELATAGQETEAR